MRKFLLQILTAVTLLCSAGIITSSLVQAEQKIEGLPVGRVAYVDRSMRFVILDMGLEDGVVENCLFEIYRKDTKIAEVKAVKIRPKFSAADIGYLYEYINVGDMANPSPESAALILAQKKKILKEKVGSFLIKAQNYMDNKKFKLARETVQEALKIDPKNMEAPRLLSKIEEAHRQHQVVTLLRLAQKYIEKEEFKIAKEKVKEALKLDPKNIEAEEMLHTLRPKTIGLESRTVFLDINAPSSLIHSSALDVLREYGFMVTFSDPLNYTLEASKYVSREATLPEKIIAETKPFTRDKVYYSVELKDIPRTDDFNVTRLIIYLKGTTDTEGRVYNLEIDKASDIYQEAREISFTIRNIAEKKSCKKEYREGEN